MLQILSKKYFTLNSKCLFVLYSFIYNYTNIWLTLFKYFVHRFVGIDTLQCSVHWNIEHMYCNTRDTDLSDKELWAVILTTISSLSPTDFSGQSNEF